MIKLDFRTLFTRPFEVYYDRLGIQQYEFMVIKEPKSLNDYTSVEIRLGSAQGLIFRSENKTGAELKCTIDHDFLGVVPCWLELVDEEDSDIESSGKYSVNIECDQISFVPRDEGGEIEDYYFGSGFEYYFFEESPGAKYITLDVDGLAIKISPNGYAVDEEGEEIRTELMFDLKGMSNLFSPASLASIKLVKDMSRLYAVDTLKEQWINSQLSKVLKTRVLKLSRTSE